MRPPYAAELDKQQGRAAGTLRDVAPGWRAGPGRNVVAMISPISSKLQRAYFVLESRVDSH